MSLSTDGWKQCGWRVDWYECPVCAAMVQGTHGVEDHAKWHDRLTAVLDLASGTRASLVEALEKFFSA